MKKLLFVPGFQEDADSRNYEAVMRAFRDNGYDPLFVNIDWRRTTQADWVKQLEMVRKEVGVGAVLAGFSFGALTALVSAANVVPAELWLFSLSPLFSEDASSWTASDKKILGKRRLAIAYETSFASLAPKVTCPVALFLGRKEITQWPEMKQVFDRAMNLLPDVQSRMIDGVGHVVDDQRYVEAIRQSIV